MTEGRKDIVSLDFNELQSLIEELGEPKFRAKQVYEWIHKKLVRSYDEMTNVPLKLRNKLEERLPFTEITEVARKDSASGDTSKFVFKLYDCYVIESVLMKYRYGNSVCI